jgi:hypothetical protein
MAKATSPVRLQAELMQAARVAGARQHRSGAEQIEYWAALGRQISHFVDPDTLLEIAAGLASLKVEPTVAPPIDPEAVFAAVETDRRSGELAKKVSTAAIRYQASATHPGYLEQIDKNGATTLGTFHNGVFIPLREDAIE